MEKIKSFLQRASGSVVVEYTIVLPFVFYIFFGLAELSFIFLVQSSLDFAVSQATRVGRTGDGTVAGRQALVNQIITKATFFGTSPTLTYQSYSSYGAVGGGGGANTIGVAGNIVVYTLQYSWTIKTPFLSSVLSSAGTPGVRKITASRLVQSEDF